MLVTAHQSKLRAYDRWLNGILALATCLGVGAVYGIGFLPSDFELQHLLSQTTALQETVQQASRISHEQQTLEQQLAKSERFAADLLLRIPTAPRESDFLAQVSQLAGDVGLEVLDYRTAATHILENHREIEVRMNTRGKYPALCRFVEQVDRLPRLSRLTSLEIIRTDTPSAPAAGTQTTPERPTDTDLSADFVFRIYFAPPPDGSSTRKG